MTQLQEALADRGRAALSGLGGVGKTQTAIEYAHRHSDEYDCIFWATGASREALVSSYETIAVLLKLPESTALDQTLAVDAVKRWFSSNQRWLLILDNADDLAAARELIPSGRSGHVLLTTRAGALGPIARRVEILEMGTAEGALFLLRRAKYISENASLDAAAEADQTTAKDITTHLDGLPLALDQAAAYIEETGCGLSDYLELYRKHTPELLRRRGVLASNYPPVATTWALSFENIEKANPAAAELLKFCSFLHSDAIPEEVFSEGAPELGQELETLASDMFALNDALSEILKYSLLRRNPNARTLEIHRLVQAVLKQGMGEATRRSWAERAVRALNRTFPDVEFSNWALCERFFAQAHACVELIDQWNLEFPEAARLLDRAGSFLSARGQYAQAAPLYERALAIREKALGPDHPDVASSLNNLARLYHDRGFYAEAAALYKRALAIREQALGPEDPGVAAFLNIGVGLYHDRALYEKAAALYERALAIREQVLGPDHPDVAFSLNNLAPLYHAQSRYEKAAPLYERALAIYEQALGPDHPDVASSLNNLAELHHDQGRYEKAALLYERALAIYEQALGPDHPDVASSLNNLAELYHAQGRYEKAAPLYERTLAIREQALGPDHPDVASSLNNLAQLYEAQGQYTKAEPLYQRALAIYEQVLGPNHPNVATCLKNYASLLRAIDHSQEAESLEARARAIRAKPG